MRDGDANESADLYEQPLDPGGVCPVVEEPPGVVTQRVVLPQALRQPVHPLHSVFRECQTFERCFKLVA